MFGQQTFTWNDYAMSLGGTAFYMVFISALVIAGIGIYSIMKQRSEGYLVACYFFAALIPSIFGMHHMATNWAKAVAFLGKSAGERMNGWDWLGSWILFGVPFAIGLVFTLVIWIIGIVWYFRWRGWRKAELPDVRAVTTG